MKTYFKKGSWNFICPVDGFKYKASEGRKRWDGQYVHKSNWEIRHPQDFLRGIKDDPSVPWTRPEQADVETDSSGWADTLTDVSPGTFDNSL